MAEKPEGDDRSMGEILASIRRIVTDEERARASAEAQRRQSEEAGDVLVLGDHLRVIEGGAGATDEPEPVAEALDDDDDDDAPLDLGRAGETLETGPAAVHVEFEQPAGLTENEVEAIVRRIVREELKGPIGQQISRKVKGLVAEEVRRALEEAEEDNEGLL